MADNQLLTSDITAATPPVTLQQPTTPVPTLPGPAEAPEYYTGFTQEYKGITAEMDKIHKQLQQAEADLHKPFLMNITPSGFFSWLVKTAPYTYLIEPLIPQEAKLAASREAQAAFDALAQQFQVLEWKAEVMNVLPVYMSDPTYKTDNPSDVLQYVAPGVNLSDADTAWLNGIFTKMLPLKNVLPEDYTGDIMETQSKILNEILTEPKLEMRGVHHLTIDEIAKAFAFSVAELPAGMSEEDVRTLLSKMELSDEELKTQREWLEERAREWELESARMSLIRAGEILAEVPELTPLEWAKMIFTQPMMATVEMLDKYFNVVSRPISAAIMMNLPAPAAGAAHGVPLGAGVGAIIGSVVPVIGTAIGAGIGALVGAISGGALFATLETDTDKKLTEIYNRYVADGDSSWSAYAKAFNEWEAPWYKKMILDSAFDPINYLGFGAVSAVGKKLATAALPRGLKWAGAKVGNLMEAFENGYIAGADVVFKAGVGVVTAPIKAGFWISGAGFTIPKTLSQMSRNFGRLGFMELSAVTRQRYPSASLVRGKLVGITTKDFESVLADVTSYALKNPTSNDLMARAGTAAMEFAYLDEAAAAKFLKGLADDVTLDATALAKFNSDLLDSFSGYVEIPGVAVTHGDRIAAGNILNRFNKLAGLSSDEAAKLVDDLASRIGKFKENIAKKVVDSVKDMAPGDAMYSLYDKMVSTRYNNLRSPFTEYMQQAGRSASWHSRVADRVLYSARFVAFERRFVTPIAKQQLLFTNFGPYNYLENSMRSFLGGAEFTVPRAYGGVDEFLEVGGKLSNCPYELIMSQRGEKRLVQAMVDPETGKALVFKKGNIPFITRDVVVPEKIPALGGKKLGRTLTIGNQKYFLGSSQDWYDMWSDLVSKQLAYDYQVHFTKALYDTPLGKKTLDGINSALDKARVLVKDIPSIKQYVSDIERLLRWKSIDSPDAIRAMADVDVLTFNRRMIGMKFNQVADKMYDIRRIIKENLYDKVLDGSMFAKGTASIDETFANALAAARDLEVASLSVQCEVMKDQVNWLIANPAKNLDDFMWDMQHLTDNVEAVRATIHDYRRLTEIRKGQLALGEVDDFEVGSSKQLAEYMNTAEESLTKYMNQLMDNAKVAGLTDVQLARLSDLDSISHLELENVLAARTKLAEIESEIPIFHKRIKGLWKTSPDRAAKESKLFWNEGTNSQRFRKSAVWSEYDNVANKLKFGRLEASRNFLMSVNKPAFVPDFVPEVLGDLTANHLAYLYGATGDDLYRGLTRVSQNTMTMPREDFIIHTREQASAYAAKLGKTADQIGFTEDAIGEVYDQMWRSLGINPNILTPDSPTALQLEELKQEMYRWYQSTKIPESDVIKWRQYINKIADDVGNLDVYKAAVAGAPPITPTVIETGQPYTAKLYRGTKLKGQPPTDEGLVGKGQYWSSSEAVAKTYDAVKEATISLQKPYVIKTQAEFDDFGNMRIRPIRDIALAEGHDEDWVQTMLRSQLENEGYDGVVISAGIVETGTQVAIFHPEKAVGAVPAAAPAKAVPAGVSGTPDWWATKESAMTKAREMHAMAYPTYDDANIIDETMRAVFPFWNYELFRWKWLPRTFMRTPGVLTGLARFTEYTDQGYVPVPGTDLQINPLRGTVFMGGLRSFYLRDFPEYHDAVPGIEFLDYIGRAGFFPGIHVMLPISMFGAAGKAPQLGQLAPAWVKTGLSALRALSPEHIGKVLEVIYPDRFRDYLTMLELGSMGYDADEIWKKKQQGAKLTAEEESLWLQAVNKVDGIKGILMNQTGLFRIRPAEFTQIRQEMHLAIEEATGVPVATQEWIDKMYPITGKRFTDYFHLDIQQQSLLYQWESYRRYQGITTPLYPSSWQALDIKISDYYDELEKIYTDARYYGVYDDSGNLLQPSIADINRQLIEGTIGPSQWRSLRDGIMDGLSEAVRILGESPAYKDVPKTFDERAALLEERGIVTPTKTPDQELLYFYYELKPELKYNWESGRMELDYDTYYAYIDALLESLAPSYRERFMDRIQTNWTPMERLYWEFSRTYARPYRNLRDIVLAEYTPEQVQIIRRFEVARGDEREQILQVMGPDGKLISGYQKQLREARQRLRLLDPTLDAWLYFFGTTDKFMSTTAEEKYHSLAKQYLVPSMIGEVK